MPIIDIIKENARRDPEKTALVLDNEVVTYRECLDRTERLSASLRQVGIEGGTHIGFMLANSTEFVIALLAAADLGAVVVPLNNTISRPDFLTAVATTDIEYVIGQKQALGRMLATDDTSAMPVPAARCISVGGSLAGCHEFEDLVSADAKEYELGSIAVEDDADYILTMTSGSTSAPKPIVFTQQTKIRRAMSARDSYGLTGDDVILVATPLYHSISQRLIFTPLLLGATCVIQRKFNPGQWLQLVDTHKVSFTIAVASQLETIFPERSDSVTKIPSVRCLVSCCALLNPATKSRLARDLPCEFHECYGASEVGVVSNHSSADPEEKMHGVGRPVAGAHVKILDGSGAPVAVGVVGEIACKSEMRYSRYYKNSTATADSFKDGYFLTGDMGFLDEDGHLFFSGRKKEVIITGGANVFPKDIEMVLNEHPDVAEAAVVGIADQRFGEAVLAVIIPVDGTTPTERDMQQFCLDKLADVQMPLAYVFVEDFPRTSLGKVIKPQLVEQYKNFDASAHLRRILGADAAP